MYSVLLVPPDNPGRPGSEASMFCLDVLPRCFANIERTIDDAALRMPPSVVAQMPEIWPGQSLSPRRLH
jgi:hypothetical protein